eukprot:m.376491 g.376491  ORF g.376491 m.376491 type:complete len:1539 (-) comp28194_c0_seq1:146-4762(-)
MIREMLVAVLIAVAPALVTATCCQQLTAFDGSVGWHDFSRYVSGFYGRPITGFTMEYGNTSICASSKRADVVNNAFNGCSGKVSYPEAKQFCEAVGARLCTLPELQADETHGSGCNYDFEHVWSSTSCPACSSTSSAFYTQWGFSQVAVKDGGARTPAECVESTELAFTRCCADTCSGTDPQGDYDALVAIRNGVTKTGAGGCPSLTDELGTWPEALPGASSAIKCPGSATDSIFRLCSAAGRWQDVQTVDTSACQAPTACDVCDCYDCGSNGRGCGAAVGLQTSSRGLEHFVDCAHKSLVVLPVNFPSNTSRIDLQGNTMVQRYSPNTFLGATRVWRIYVQGLLRLTSVVNLFDDLTSLEVFDSADLPLVDSLPVLNSPVLETLILHFWNLGAGVGSPFRTCPGVRAIEVSNCPNFRPDSNFLAHTTGVASITFVGNRNMELITDGMFNGAQASLTSIKLRYNHALASLPHGMLARTDGLPLLSVEIDENAALRSIGGGTFRGMNGVSTFVLESSNDDFTVEAGAFDGAGPIHTLTIEGIDLANTIGTAFRGLSGVLFLNLIGLRGGDFTGAAPMLDDDPFQNHITAVHKISMEQVKVSSLSPRLFQGLAFLVEVDLRCVPLLSLNRSLFSAANTNLKSFTAIEMPTLSTIDPYMFADVPSLEAIDLSSNPSLVELGPNVFDGAFAQSAVARPRVLLSDSNLQTISKRAFNFDSTGIASKAVITVGTRDGLSGLLTCCGYEWLLIDRHFATLDLQCLNTGGGAGTVRLASDIATLHCCFGSAEVDALQTLRTFTRNPNYTSFPSLPVAAQVNVTRLCANADWITADGNVDRACGAACTTDTSVRSALSQVLQPGATTCAGAETTCPSGYRIELAGPLHVLECEPWKHRASPDYETRHFVGELVCEKCGVLGCAQCDASSRACSVCDPNMRLLTDKLGEICVSACPAGYTGGVNLVGSGTCVAQSPSSSTSDVGPVIAGVLVPIILIFLVVFGVFYWHTQRKFAKLEEKLGDYVEVTEAFAQTYVPADDVDTFDAVADALATAAQQDMAAGLPPSVVAAPPPKALQWWRWEEDPGRLNLHDAAMLENNFVAYDPATNDQIEKAFQAYTVALSGSAAGAVTSSIVDVVLGGQKKAGAQTGAKFSVDLEKLLQINKLSGHTRNILRSDAPQVYADKYTVDLTPAGPPPGPADSTTGSSRRRPHREHHREERHAEEVDANTVRRNHSAHRAASLLKYGLPQHLIDQGDELLPLRVGLLVEVMKRGEQGWFYGTTIFDPDDPNDKNGVIGQSGWFESVCTVKAPRSLVQRFNSSLGHYEDSELNPPETWTDVENMTDVVRLIPVSLEAPEVQPLLKEWQTTMNGKKMAGCYPVRGRIHKIDRIQNKPLWQSYAVKRIQIRNRDNDPNAKPHPNFSLVKHNAWHGTTEEIVGKIIQQGFNRSFCGRNMCRYGKGVYFARDAAYSAQPQYATAGSDGYCRMLSCRVLHGIYCKGTDNGLTPDVYDATTNRLYDSTVNDIVDPIMWITYHDSQAYPEYMLYFTVD